MPRNRGVSVLIAHDSVGEFDQFYFFVLFALNNFYKICSFDLKIKTGRKKSAYRKK